MLMLPKGTPAIVSATLTVSLWLGPVTVRALQPARPGGADEVEVLTRGPVHEAFAETVTYDPEPSVIVERVPPNPINEMPPNQRPEGDTVTWIPGYTAWDDERDDYLWVSGVWRSPPPGRQWISGYWGRSGIGFQWTSGYWGDALSSDVDYLPEPPQSLEEGLSIPSAGSDQSWIPGSWVWHGGRYAWRPGYWVALETNWDWVPAHYRWSPRGYVFVDGYWDYSVARRGVLFAPVYFGPGVYARRDYHYAPSTVISLSVFSDHLFVRPRYHHYYFGDYYDARYHDAGYYNRAAFRSGRHGYDPIYARQRWMHRNDRDWEARVESDYLHRREHVDARPPRTMRAQVALTTSGQNGGGVAIAASLEQLASSKQSPMRFKGVDTAEKEILIQRGKEVSRFRQERRDVESQAVRTESSDPEVQPRPSRGRLPRSAIVARPADELGTDRAPPRRQMAPDPDPRVEAKPRKTRGKVLSPEARSTERPASGSKDGARNKSKNDSNDD